MAAEQRFAMLPQQPGCGPLARFPDTPHDALASTRNPAAPMVGMDMSMTTEPAPFRGSLSRSGHAQNAVYATPTTSLTFEASLYADTSSYMLGRASPSSYHEDGDMRLGSSSLSTASAPSAPSSAMGSPQSNHGQPGAVAEWNAQGMAVQPSIVGNDYMAGPEYFTGSALEPLRSYDFGAAQPKTFVDPSLIHPDVAPPPMPMSPFSNHFQQAAAANPFVSSPSVASPQPTLLRTSSSSPYLHGGPFPSAFPGSPYGVPVDALGRRVSMAASFISPASAEYHSGDESREKQRCSYPDCGKVFKDLKAHMLTHQNERPEKCPIHTCEYHLKGFARKYDKNRHTLTHYKGTMVCGFCPGSGSPAEKSFNRADVFKRHLTAVHGVEQTPPNSRKKTPVGVGTGKKLVGYAPDATGKCSTCSQNFANAQDFYEHLDDCVLRIVQQEDPAEAINAQRLAEVENDRSVHQTLEKNNLPTATPTMQTDDYGDDDEMGEDDDADDAASGSNSSPSARKKNPPNGVQKSRGLTHSRGGVPLATRVRGRKNRRDYPSSWGFDKGQMNMKKRIMAVFDGSRRLAKDDMMLSTDHEVRIKLSDGNAYVTDLDVQTLNRAEGFLGATDAEKGPWLSDDPDEAQLGEMKEILETTTVSSI
ncbi:zinc finger domain-containing protein [Drechmeria coniospora]|uniref:Zinc finger domain-containing protein n=1 Tax=Drechmeria coniospora TaxID=98403 RepID=A0A151GRD0_DRECN|nr:zinc finger domain-containing protein [Drechmeria coniospora]KYK59643.1 zinc finger domain-containing protein [Drechmeria coniospora]